MEKVVIVSAKRTPLGALQGELAKHGAPDLAGQVIKGFMHGEGLPMVDEVILGCVLTAGLGQAPVRQALHKGGLPWSVGATHVSKVCGSGLKAVMIAADMIKAGNTQATIAGGMESMSQAPYLLPKVRQGLRMGHAQCLDHMFFDGLQDAYEVGTLMGVFAERCAKHYGFSREQQDTYALTSLERARQASFANELISLGNCSSDELPRKAKPEKIPTLKPAFEKDGTVTAANASAISDGAAALYLCKESFARDHKLDVLAHIVAYTSFAHEPQWFTTAPVGAIRNLCNSLHWDPQAVDAFEINEAFAVVTMAAMQGLQLSHEQVNPKGGACALGHPIGASGARILTTLIHHLREQKQRRGIASLCIGGGEAVAMAVECC